VSTLEWVFVAVVVGVLLVGGSMVAVWWWRLVARAAPYKDEIARPQTRSKADREQPGVIVVNPDNGDVKR
jgi:hypothetical protein